MALHASLCQAASHNVHLPAQAFPYLLFTSVYRKVCLTKQLGIYVPLYQMDTSNHQPGYNSLFLYLLPGQVCAIRHHGQLSRSTVGHCHTIVYAYHAYYSCRFIFHSVPFNSFIASCAVCVQCLDLMRQSNFSAVAITDGTHSNKLIGNFSVSDLRSVCSMPTCTHNSHVPECQVVIQLS